MKVQVILGNDGKWVKLHCFGWVSDRRFVSKIKTKLNYKIYCMETEKWQK